MTDRPDAREDARKLDVRVDTPARDGLAGTAPSSVFAPLADPELVTIPPDGRPLDAQPDWRKDFPIDWPEDHYVARRDFVKYLTLTSLAFSAGQIWLVAQNWWRRRRGRPPEKRIAALASIAPGSSITFKYPGDDDDAILVRAPDGALVAYGQECTHLSCAVIPKPEKGMIHCPCHEGLFDLMTGRPVAGPPRRPLDRIVLEVRNGQVWATALERRTI